MEQLVSLQEARDQGLAYYFTGKPCKRGGIARRQTSNKNCLCDKCSAYREEQLAGYRARNAEALSKKKAEWYSKNAGHVADRNKSRRSEISATAAKWRERNAEYVSQYQRDYAERNRSRKAAYRKAESARFAAHAARRRGAKKNAVPIWFSELDELAELEAHSLAQERGIITGIKWEVDHMFPLQAGTVCGLHCADNIQVIPAVMNSSKRNKITLTERGEWLRT